MSIPDYDVLLETKSFRLKEMEGHILRFDYHDDVMVELEDVIEAFEVFEQYSPDLSHKVLIVFGKYTLMEVDARCYAEGKDMRTPAQAIVIQNLAQRLLARFYIKLRKNTHPLRFFTNVEDALIWLRTV